MRRTLAILCLLAGLSLAPLRLSAQGLDPAQEQFVQAFLNVRKAEQQANAGELKTALRTYRAAAETLAKIKQQWPTWQKDLVEFRLQRTNEAIAQLQGRVGPDAAAPAPGDEPAPPITDAPSLFDPPQAPPEPKGTAGNAKRPATVKNTGNANPLEMVKERIASLEGQLEEANEKLATEQKKSEQLAKDLKTAVDERRTAETERKKAQDRAAMFEDKLAELKSKGEKDSEKVRELEAQLSLVKRRNSGIEADLAAAEERITQLVERSRTMTAKAAAAGELPAHVKSLEAKLATELTAKQELASQLTTMTRERDDARAEITRLKELNKQADKLMADNAGLLKKLGEAEKQILSFKTESPQKDAQLAMLQKQVTDVQKALAASQEKNTTLSTEIDELQKKVGDYTKQIQAFKTDKNVDSEERRKMEEENRLLQGIVMRVLQEDANRSQRRKMVQKEMERLQIQSDVLLAGIGYLSQPVVKLSSAERRLFKKPKIEVDDPSILVVIKPESEPAPSTPAATASASDPSATAPAPAPAPPASAAPSEPPGTPPPATPPPAVAPTELPVPDPEKKPEKKSEPEPTKVAKLENQPVPLPKPDEPPAASETPESMPPKPAVGGVVRSLPEEVKPLADDAKVAFDGEKYGDAEKLYDKALQLAPNNLFLISNKAVVQFRMGKYKQAEESFRKALAIAPEDHFCWGTLGIVQYSQGKYDDAVNSLTKSLAINPKNATAHNYLGITAAQKGWLEAAQKEIDTAIQLDAKYADAWFNQAVIQTLKQPPNKEEARRCYKKAVELGAEADPAMESLIK